MGLVIRKNRQQKFSQEHLPQASPSTPDSSRQLNIFLHYRDSLGMYSAQIRVLKQVHQERFATFLQCLNGLRLPAVSLAAYIDHTQGNLSDLSGISV